MLPYTERLRRLSDRFNDIPSANPTANLRRPVGEEMESSDPVLIRDYDPSWPHAFANLASRVRTAHEGDLGITGRHAFRCPPGEALHHLYVLAAGADELRRHLAFRDALRESEVLRCRYSALKRCLAKKFKGDRGSYTRAKSVFIASVIGTD